MRHGIGLFVSAAWIVAGIILLLVQKSHNDAIVLLCFLIIGMGLMALLVTAISSNKENYPNVLTSSFKN